MKTRSDTKPPGAIGQWAAYVPSDKVPWNLRRVVHLHCRAGFASTWGVIQRDLREGPTASIDRLLAGKVAGPSVPDDFARIADLLGESALSANDPARLKAWWVYRMLFGPDPLTERLTLMWHNHFATSNSKVADLSAMHRQNELFRSLGRGRFGDLLNKVVRDPAMLLWLDAPANRREHPNENLARELMELFTLGIGPYSEKDVKEAARALTGWAVDDDGRFGQKPNHHDDGEKTILGRKGKWNGDDLVRQLLEHPATSERLADRLCGLFLGEGAASASEVAALAHGLRTRQLDIGWAVETILRSQTFFADVHIGNRVISPVEYVVNGARRWRCSIRAQYACAGRLGGAVGTRPVLSAKRRRLAGWSRLDQHALRGRPGQLRRGTGRRRQGGPSALRCTGACSTPRTRARSRGHVDVFR